MCDMLLLLLLLFFSLLLFSFSSMLMVRREVHHIMVIPLLDHILNLLKWPQQASSEGVTFTMKNEFGLLKATFVNVFLLKSVLDVSHTHQHSRKELGK